MEEARRERYAVVKKDVVVYQLHDMLDRFVSIGHMFGFGRKEIMERLRQLEAFDEQLRRDGSDPNRYTTPIRPGKPDGMGYENEPPARY
jgi:hypothetical protein